MGVVPFGLSIAENLSKILPISQQTDLTGRYNGQGKQHHFLYMQ